MLCYSTTLSNALNAPSNLKATAVSSRGDFRPCMIPYDRGPAGGRELAGLVGARQQLGRYALHFGQRVHHDDARAIRDGPQGQADPRRSCRHALEQDQRCGLSMGSNEQ
jgi:hypothetical protein